MPKKKNFLPVVNHNVEIPLVEDPTGALEKCKIYRPTVSNDDDYEKDDNLTKKDIRRIRRRTRMRMRMTRIFSTLLFLSLISGSTFLGFSLNIIGSNQVGYYQEQSIPIIKGPRIVFNFPWVKDHIHIADVGTKFFEYNNLRGSLKNNSEFLIQNVNVIVTVRFINTYIRTLRRVKSPTYCSTLIKQRLIIEFNKSFNNSSIRFNNICGFKLHEIVLTTPLIYSRDSNKISTGLISDVINEMMKKYEFVDKSLKINENHTTSLHNKDPLTDSSRIYDPLTNSSKPSKTHKVSSATSLPTQYSSTATLQTYDDDDTNSTQLNNESNKNATIDYYYDGDLEGSEYEILPTEILPTEILPTESPSTKILPTKILPTEIPSTEIPSTEILPTEGPLTESADVLTHSTTTVPTILVSSTVNNITGNGS